MTILTPDLAHAMLEVYHQRLKDDPSTRYSICLLDAALWGDVKTSPLPNFIRKLKSQYHGELKRRSDSAWLG